MANTYTQIHIQVVTAVKYRQAMIHPDWKHNLHKYMTGIIQNHNHKSLAINSMPDHIHFFFGFRPHQSLSSLVGIVKKEASEWINLNSLTERQFRWQEGYGAFSYTKSLVGVVSRYIENQETHHNRKTFLEEYQELLDEFEVDYDQSYCFKRIIWIRCCPYRARNRHIAPTGQRWFFILLCYRHIAPMGQG